MSPSPYPAIVTRLERGDRDALLTTTLVMVCLYAGKVAFCWAAPDVLSGRAGLEIDLLGLLLCAPLILAAGYAAVARRNPILVLALAAPALSLLGGTAGLRTQFIVFHVGREFDLVDARLAAWDAAVGFDWTSYFRWVVEHPYVNWILTQAYQSIWCQPLILSGLFILKKRVREYCRLQIALPLSFVLVCLVATVLPALGAYQFHGMTPDRHPGIPLAFADGMTDVIRWLRHDALPPVMPPFPDLRVITFPSWHAAAAVIFVLAAWPLPRWRFPALALNLLMLAATPVQGSHFLTDIVVGAVIGSVSFSAAAGVLQARPIGRLRIGPWVGGVAVGAHGTGPGAEAR